MDWNKSADFWPQTGIFAARNPTPDEPQNPDSEQNTLHIHDWRAPVSGLFYDAGIGEASFETPGGTTHGVVTLQRQYRIRNGRMEFMLESDLNIHDDVLQKELCRTSDVRMQNIVATIHKSPATH